MEMTTVCSKKSFFSICEGKYRTFRKPPLFGKNGKGLAHRFGQKMKIFNPLRFHSIIVSTCRQTHYDPRLFQKRMLGQMLENSKTAPFSKKWQGVSSSFWPKNENFQSSPFSHHDSPNIPLEWK